MSNYGPSFPTGGQPPGGQPYGSPYGGGQQPRGTDGVSITGFVLSLTCCLSFVGAILGFIGLGRTKNNQRKGRWAAISAIIIGILGTLVAGGVIAFFVLVSNQFVTPGNAEVGQCIDIEEIEDGDADIALAKADCTDDHDAEIVHTGKYSDVENASGDEDTVCREVVSDEILSAVDDFDSELTFGLSYDGRGSDDNYVCFVEAAGGGQLDSPVLD